MKRYYKITTNTPDETVVTGLSEPWLLLDKSETSKDNFIFQRSINNLTLDLCEGNINTVENFVNRDEEHALMCIQNTDNTYTVIYKKEKTELSSDSIYKSCKNIILPNSITKINPETFKDCSNLENITLPNSISEIGDGAFYGCENLTIIKVPSRVTRINSNLFNSCTNLTKAYIPNNIHYISKIAFNECENLTEIILYNELTNSEKHCYANENGEISIDYYDENGEQKNIIININNSGDKEWELHELTPANNVILYKKHNGSMYDFDGGTNTSYVEGYTINDDGTHSPSTELDIESHESIKDKYTYQILFGENTNISKIIGAISSGKQFFYFDSDDLKEIYLPVSVTDINNCVFNTPNLSTLLLPPNISLKQCKLPTNTETGKPGEIIEVLHNCGNLKNILYNGTSEEFNKIINNSETASSTWYKDLPYKFTVTCLDKVLNFVNNYKYEILYKAPLVANRDYAIKRVSTSIYITTSELTPTNDNYNILQFDYTSDKKKLNGYYEASNGGYECYCLQSDAITELVLPNGIEEIDALAFNCPNLTTITLPNSIKRFKTVRYTDVLSADLETVNRTLIFGSNIETIYFNGTEYEWNAIDKNLNWNPEGKEVKVICRDNEFVIKSVDDIPYQMVDLGLPSGLIWADRNVGAETPQDNGLYFSWGNIEGHAVDENGYTMYRYSFDKNIYNETLGSQYTGSELATEYDAATANMGGEWHMPTIEDISELVENTNHYYIDDDGNTVKKSELSSSRKLRSICFVKKDTKFDYNVRGNFIEFPFAGNCNGPSLWNDGFYGYIWSSSIYKSDTKSACALATLNTGYINYYNAGLNRYLGSAVRGVRGPLEYKMIDLGLPSGLKWADRNVGAETPQDNGLYFDWGNVEGHRVDENGNTIDGYSFNKDTYATTLGDKYTGRILDIEHDAAAVNMSGNWRMPTVDELIELLENTYYYYIYEDGVNFAGPFNYETNYKDTGLDGSKLRSICFVKKDTTFDYSVRDNFIEFPFAGFNYDSLLKEEGTRIHIWSSSIYKNNPTKSACGLDVMSNGIIFSHHNGGFACHCGCSIRGVYAPIEYNMVDLGLSVKWADRNVGAKTPRDNGLYFSWGNVDGHAVGKSGNTIDGYSFDSDTYATTSGGQYTDSTLDVEHDAATVNMGSNWRMPTKTEITELVENTYHYYIDLMGNIVNESELSSSKKLRSICFVKKDEDFDYDNRTNFIEFLVAGRCTDSLLVGNGLYGFVWTSSVCESVADKDNAHYLYLSRGIISPTYYGGRYSGNHVRGVCVHETFDYQEIIAKQNTIIEKLNQQNQSLQKTLETLNLNNQQLTDQNNDLRNDIADKDTEIDNLTKQNETLGVEIDEKDLQISNLTNEVETLEDENQELTNRNTKLNEQIKSVTSETFTKTGTFRAPEGVLGWDEITINVPTTETPEVPEVPEIPEEPEVPEDNQIEYQMIDLNLPSGLKWADRNVGAETPQDNGLYFSCGNVEGHAVGKSGNTIDGYSFDSDTYATTSGSQYTGSQYTGSTLDAEHDAAVYNMAEKWRMPTVDEINELVKYTVQYYIDDDGNILDYSKLDGSNLRSICFVKQGDDFDYYDNRTNFIEIPIAGRCFNTSVNDENVHGYIWSSSVTYSLYFGSSGDINCEGGYERYVGLPVRGVFEEDVTSSTPESGGNTGGTTGGGTNTGVSTCKADHIYINNETTGWTEVEITNETEDKYIQSGACIRIEGTNLVTTTDNKFNFSFNGNSTLDEIKDPNNNGYWMSHKKTAGECKLECVVEEKYGITLTPPYVSPFLFVSGK